MTGDPAALERLARQALEQGGEEEAVTLLRAGAERAGDNPRLWHWTALLDRALDQHESALAALARAAALAPHDPAVAHCRALVTLEAGLDAVALFEAADRLNPGNSELMLQMAAARYAVGEGAQGVRDLDAMLAAAPGWVDGHHGLARLRCLMGEPQAARLSYDRAIAAQARDPALRHALIRMLVDGDRYAEAAEAISQARAALGGDPFLDANEAVALSETGAAAAADALFATLPTDDLGIAMRHIRHLLRTGRVEAALPLIERWAVGEGAQPIWPYAAIAWRMTGDPRRDWLDGDERLVSVIDLTDRLPPLDGLAEVLRAMHLGRGEPLDQTVRGGTQTDGVLFTRTDPMIRALRAAVVEAVEAHIGQLPPSDPAHPVLRQHRDRRVCFSGAWSVRLAGAGRHTNHIHPRGWFSSALYVSLPEPGAGHEGWFKLGEPPDELGLGLSPTRWIEPRPGRLVLFPSTMWHGTAPFAAGERLTVAFDVAQPR